MLLDTLPSAPFVIEEKDLRRQINRSVSRALVDGEYATLLLTDPTVVLEDRGCSQQQRTTLRSINANSLVEFARQARGLFWAGEPLSLRNPISQEDQLPLAVAAAR
jgi:hypothetical protein